MIGPKGKVINTIQSETGADISVDDDGVQGIVTIGAVESWRMEEAEAAILAIVDPPKAQLGKAYDGRRRQHHGDSGLRRRPCRA